MTPEKVPMQDPGIWGYVGLLVGGFISRVAQGDTVSWKWVTGLAGSLILLLLSGIVTLSFLGIRSIQDNMIKVELSSNLTSKAVGELTTEFRVSHAKTELTNKIQDDCIKRIENQIDKMRGVKVPRLGGGEMGDSK